jgi:hypothetical protein
MANTLQAEIDAEVLRASRRMAILENIDDKSADYIRGFLWGVALQNDFLCELFMPRIEHINDTIDRLVEAWNV